MFGKKKNSINKVVVSSKEELKTAIKRKNPYIEVQGDLAKKMKWMGKLSSAKIAAPIRYHTLISIIKSSLFSSLFYEEIKKDNHDPRFSLCHNYLL